MTSSMADRLRADRSGLQILQACRQRHTSLTNFILQHIVSKASAFRFVSQTVCSPYPTLKIRRLSFSSRRCTYLEQSFAAYHICSVTSRLLLLLQDILLYTNSVTCNYCCRAILWTRFSHTYILIRRLVVVVLLNATDGETDAHAHRRLMRAAYQCPVAAGWYDEVGADDDHDPTVP